jgi:hypothetical protein
VGDAASEDNTRLNARKVLNAEENFGRICALQEWWEEGAKGSTPTRHQMQRKCRSTKEDD